MVPFCHWLEFTFEHFKNSVSKHTTIDFPILSPLKPSPLLNTIALYTSNVCLSILDNFVKYYSYNVSKEAAQVLESEDINDCHIMNHNDMPDTQAVMNDDLPPKPPVLTALMQEIIPKPPRN